MILGSFLVYFIVVLRGQKDKRVATSGSGDIRQPLCEESFREIPGILVSSSSYFMILGSFWIYSNVVLRGWREERVATFGSGDIRQPLCEEGFREVPGILMNSSPYFMILGLILICFIVVWRGWRDNNLLGFRKVPGILMNSLLYFMILGSFLIYSIVACRGLKE